MQVLLQHKAMDGERMAAPGQGKMGGTCPLGYPPLFPLRGYAQILPERRPSLLWPVNPAAPT